MTITSTDKKEKFELSFGPPPVLPDVTKQLKEYLLCPETLPIHDYEKAQQFWPREPNPGALYFSELLPPPTTLKVIRDPTTGEMLDICEVENVAVTQRKISRQATDNDSDTELDEVLSAPLLGDLDFEGGFLTIPNGFSQGLEFAEDGFTPLSKTPLKTKLVKTQEENLPAVKLEEEKNVVNLVNLLNQEHDILGLWKEPVKESETTKDRAPVIELKISQVEEEEEEAVIPQDLSIGPVLNISKATITKPVEKTQWAEEIDVSTPVVDFKEKVPNPAFTWSFELDTFQKQAIMKLEEQENVFVAAHTSAGKTVVAEYAIATSLRSKQRAIYTSPIKALSNQKFRDFKKVFEEEHKLGEVGLITGDFQLNPKAGCLIMTTEILRSMLYKQNEVINDLAYVIFDEVHYINDRERGYVWEEVVILLPKTVSIVMLSATVPNTMEFANWVGCTTKRKVFVISTLKRPIPLQHHLYTGTGRQTRNNCFLIRDGEGKLILEGLHQAIASREKKEKDPTQDTGRGGGRGGRGGPGGWRGGGGGRGGRGGGGGRGGSNAPRFMGPKQEKQMWEGLIEYLSEKDNLPVVAFTLSRNRCDNNADLLSNIDLTTKDEKHYIHTFFKKSISRLKEEDQKLPQILKLQTILEKGIGVHHSGILPILKEIVELLFQESKVKLLFATETFAMGVNMPARTVVFDSVKKFDGTNTRPLLPAEYIQMAGRAGRRGKDTTGKVIILCKTEIPEEHVLKSMMFDKPMKLESQFRMTYAMILKNLQRNMEADVTVENMITRSFKEFPEQAKHSTYRKELSVLKKLLEDEEMKRGGVKRPGEDMLEEFFDHALEYIKIYNEYQALAIIQPKAVKGMVIGRMLLISYQDHVNKYGILVGKANEDSPKAVYRVLVLTNQGHPEKPKYNELYYQMVALMRPKQRFVWDGKGGHTILKLQPVHITKLTLEIIRVDAEGIIRDWEKRQQPRFKDDPVGPSCKSALQELAYYSETRIYGNWFDIKEGRNLDLANMRHSLFCHEELLKLCKPTEVLNCDQIFLDVFYRKDIEQQIKKIKHKLSAQSSSLFPDFQNKLMFLQELQYINADNVVQMKGNVATRMGSNELMITELVFRNVLSLMQPAEIAALLSGLVFQAKSNRKPKEDLLKKGKEEIEKINKELVEVEKGCEIGVHEDSSEFVDRLNFDLLEVVYEWASNKPFAEIMKLTDVQEGLIVRCIQQLSETLNYVKGAAAQLGDRMLETKMEEVKDLIKRDIVFAASLYTQ